jgi:hypothetical protein
MLINLAMLGVALIAVVAAVVYKARNDTPETAAATPPALAAPSDGGIVESSIALPAGSHIVSQSLSGDRVSLQVEGQGGERSLYIFDLAVGRMVAHFAIKDQN